MIIERELAVKLVTLRLCKYYKWECVRKVEHREIWAYHLLTFGRESFVGVEWRGGGLSKVGEEGGR